MTEFSDRILNWYQQNARVLPWRGLSDPYAIWVSEIMLQQTRVETVIPYFERWMRQFPGVKALAEASQQQVLSAWEGLGYYSRARNLQQAARMVMDDFGGKVPESLDELRTLPGVGRYTAAAIASIAFGRDEATLDGNLRRVFARVFDVAIPADSPAGENLLWDLAQSQLPAGRAGDYNQALMDLGSSICLPKKPLCLLCPLADLCRSRSAPESRPVLKPKAAVPHRQKMACVIIRDGCVLLGLRPARGLLGGLWEFPAVEVELVSPESMQICLAAHYGLRVSTGVFLTEVNHTYTHFSLSESVWFGSLEGQADDPALHWVDLSELPGYPMGKVDRAIARKIGSVH
ncbi:MAG TPA: A/G-specific adenine glycosylase [Anaerolineales bacterium]|jgi:A/G-specific adenine glycosylase